MVFYTAAFFFFFIRSALSFPSVDFLPVFLWNWVFRTAMLGFADAFLPVTLTGSVVYFSLVFVYRKDGDTGGIPDFFHTIATSSIVILMVLTLVFSFLSEGIKPAILSAVETMRYKTELARGFYDKAEDLKAQGLFSQARDAIRNYLRIDPANQDALKMDRDLLRMYGAALLEQESEATVTENEKTLIKGMNSEELMRKAEDAFTAEDYATAHYYANLATAIDPANREAKAIGVRALEKLSRSGLTREEKIRSDLFIRKKAAYDALQKGDTVGAFYLFSTLKEEYPEDPDITKYLELAGTRLRMISFFREEVEDIAHLPGERDILLVNEKTDGETEILSIGKFLNLDAGAYLFDIEVIRFDLLYRPVYHFTAPYGKIIDGLINMYCVDKEDPSKNLKPEYLSGEREEELRNILPLSVAPDRLGVFSVSKVDLDRLNIFRLWSLRELKGDHGFRSEPLEIEFMARIIRIFSFFVLSLFAVSVGWSLRPAGKPPILVLVFIPLFPFALQYVVTLYLFASRLLLGVLYFGIGFLPAAAVFIVLQLMLVIAALIFLAGQTTKR